MFRMHYLIAAVSLFFMGCADTSAPTASNSPGDTMTVTANKPPAGEALPEGAMNAEGERSAELPAPDESLLPPEDGASETADQSAEARAMRELKEAGDAVADWSAKSKDELVTMAEEYLNELDAKMANLKTRGEEFTGDAKTRWEAEQQTLDQKRAAFQEKLEALRTSGDAAWQDMAQGLMNAWNELKHASQEAASEFN